jgi:hypothetical protein
VVALFKEDVFAIVAAIVGDSICPVRAEGRAACKDLGGFDRPDGLARLSIRSIVLSCRSIYKNLRGLPVGDRIELLREEDGKIAGDDVAQEDGVWHRVFSNYIIFILKSTLRFLLGR